MPKIALLYDAGQAVLSTFDLDEVLHRILGIARDYFHLPNAAILLVDKEAQQLKVRAQIGWDPGQDQICLGWHEGITGAAVQKKQPVYAPDVSRDPRYVCKAQRPLCATCLVNALTPPVFRGEGVSSYSRAGRIPGSVNAPWTSLIDPETNRFREPSELREALDQVGALSGTPVIAYCGGGISATVDLFALSLLGRGDARLYDGSLTEWSRDPSLPLEVG